jgi:flagellar protein FlbT
MRISLHPGEKIYINGAVLRVDRKVGLELLNNATFLLENHVIQADDATTPLRQLYFVVQTMLMEPGNADPARDLFARMLVLLRKSFSNPEVLAGLDSIDELVVAGRGFEALKTIRGLLPIEALILSPDSMTQAA